MIYETYEGQSIIDVCVLNYGDISKLFDLVRSNSKPLTFESTGGGDAIELEPASLQPPGRIPQRQQALSTAKSSQVIVYAGQNTPDLALQEYGSIEGLFMLILDNSLAADSDFVPGTMLKVRAEKVRKDVVSYYSRIAHRVNTSAEILTADNAGEFSDDFANDFNT